MILHSHLGFMPKCIREIHFFLQMCNNVNCICNLQMPVLRLNILLNDASYVFVFINGKQFNPESLSGQEF